MFACGGGVERERHIYNFKQKDIIVFAKSIVFISSLEKGWIYLFCKKKYKKSFNTLLAFGDMI